MTDLKRCKHLKNGDGNKSIFTCRKTLTTDFKNFSCKNYERVRLYHKIKQWITKTIEKVVR